VIATVHGDLATALRMHAFGPVLLTLFAGIWVYSLIGLVNPPAKPVWEKRAAAWALFLLLACYLAYWAIRILTGTTPP
jgi:hypothetical protein